MNKIYKLVWSKVRNTWVVASEIAKGHGKNASATRERKLLKTAVITAIMGGCLMTGGLASAELTPEQKVVYDAVMAELEKGGGVHYFSVKSKDQMPNYNKDGAKGETSVAIGPGSTTKFRNGLSVGTNNLNEGYETTVVGSLNKAYGLGDSAYAYGATIVGTGNTIMSNKGTLAMGSENIVHEGIAIGAGNKAMGENAIALGNYSSAMYSDTIGIGFGAHGYADDVIAIGRAAEGDALGGVAIGRYAEVHASTGVALGESSVSSRGAGFVGYMPGVVGQTAEEVAAYLGKADEYKSWKEDRKANQGAYDRAKAWHAAVDAERKAHNEVNQARIAYAEAPTEANEKAITEKQEAWKKASDERQKTDVAMRPDFKTINDLNARYGQIFGKLMSTEGAVSVGDEKTGRTRQIINVAAGTKDTDAVNVYQLKALNTKMDKGAIHYFSVKSDDSARPAGTNWNNDGAKGKGAVAIGEKAMASKGGTVSIGRNAHIEGNGGNASGEGSVAIGDNALITTNGLDLASIALGKNAKVLNGSGKQERGLSFTPDNFDKPGFFGRGNTLPKNADKVPGGIAIGTNTFARTGSIQLGHHTFAGYKMGGIDVTNANEEANIVGMTTIGTNTYNKGVFANMYGAYSIITGGFTGEGGGNSLSYGPQNFGANVVGSLNSIRSKGHSGSSGIANSIVGVANTVENTNGTLVYGAGNKITNSNSYISAPSGLTTLNTWEDTVTALQKTIKDSNSGGAVLAIGGGNVADYVRHSQLVGVNNTVTGTENKVSEFNMVNGYQNTATNITHVTMIGSDNEVKDTNGAVLLGDKRELTGADGSIVLGAADAEADKKVATNVKDATVIGHNANTTVEGGVALGSGSVADRAGFTKETKGVFSDVNLNGKTDGAVSVGTKDKLRQIINVGDATEDTDAVNLRQLRALGSKVDNSAIHYFSVKSKDQMANYDNKGAQGERSVAIGPGSTTKFRDSLSVGTSNTNEGYETVLVGNQNKAYGLDRGYEYAIGATIVGTGNTIMSNKGTMAMGSENIVYQGIAIGAKNKAMGENAVALGNFSSAMYTDSVGIGFGTHGDADGVVAIGRAATGDALGGVAIGRYAEVHASTGVALGDSSVSSRGAGVVGYMPGAVGQTAEEVAAYLGKAEEYKSWKADVEKNKDAYTRAKAWHAAVDAERKAFREINEARIAYAENSTEENKKAITEKYDAWKKASAHRQETDVAMRPDFKTINDLNARYGQIFGKLMSTGGAVSVGNEKEGITRQIINVAAGTKDTDAVNVYQLKVVNAKADKNAEAITNLTNTVNANGKATIVKVDGNENNADGNLKIKKTEKDGQLTYDLSLNDEIHLGKVGEDGKDGKIGINGKDGTSAEIRTGQGKAGVDGKDGETTTRIIYKDKGGKDHEVATLDDGLKFKGDNDTVVTRKLNEQLNITGGITDAKELSDNNIGVVGTQDGGMAVKLSKKLKGLTSAEFKDGDNVTNITAGDVTVTKKEGNETKTVNIWDLNKTVNDIKTGATDVSSWKLQANGEDKRTIKKNDIVNFKNGEKTAVTVKGNDITVDLNEATKKQISDNTTNITNIDKRVTSIEKNIDQKIEGAKITVKGNKDTGIKVKEDKGADGKVTGYEVSLEKKVKVGNVTIDGTGEGADSKGEITGLTNKTLDSDDFATKGRAATEEQLKAAMAQAVAQGTTTVKAGDQNISVVKTENKNEYTVKLAKDITVDSVTAKTVKADEYKVGDKTYINKDGINANGNKITNVGDGKISKDSTDAVNGKQLYGVEQKVNQNTTNINKLQNNIYDMGMKVGELDTRVNKVGAGAAALAALHPLDFDPDDKWDFAAGYGNYKGANAAAIGAYYRPNEDTMFSVGGSFGGGENMVNAGVSVKLGQGNHVSTSKVAMAKDMLAMQKRMAEMEAQMAKMQGFIGALTGMDTQTAMFPDVPENHWAYEYVKGLCEQGIIEGYPDGNFNGNRSMTRYEFAAMLYRALAKGVNLDARAVKEFAPELGRIRVDVISQNKEGQPVIERVRVNEEKKEK